MLVTISAATAYKPIPSHMYCHYHWVPWMVPMLLYLLPNLLFFPDVRQMWQVTVLLLLLLGGWRRRWGMCGCHIAAHLLPAAAGRSSLAGSPPGSNAALGRWVGGW